MMARSLFAAVLSTTFLATAPVLAAGGAPAAGHRDMNALFPQPKPDLQWSQAPAKPELEGPSFYEKIGDTKVVLKWKETAGATAYHVQVATDPNFKWLVKEENILKATSLEVGGLETGKSYFWRVAGLKTENKSGHLQGSFAASMFETAGK